jgi:hypothetical protein
MEAAAGDMRCWCTQLPPLPLSACQQGGSDITSARCFCPDCLRLMLATVPRENR